MDSNGNSRARNYSLNSTPPPTAPPTENTQTTPTSLDQHQPVVYTVEYCGYQVPGSDKQLQGENYIPNPKLKSLRKTNLILHLILCVSSVIVAVTYLTLWLTLVSPPLDLVETGNWAVFLFLFFSCGVVFFQGALMSYWHLTGAKLTYTQAYRCVIVLAFCIGLVATVYHGSMESSKGKYERVWKTTAFGVYISKVCGTPAAGGEGSYGSHAWDDAEYIAKCDATKRFKTIIYSMYAWVGGMIVVVILDFAFGLSNWSYKYEEEMILASADPDDNDKDKDKAAYYGYIGPDTQV